MKFTTLEFQMLKLLHDRKGEVVTREDFLNLIWGEDNTVVTERTVDSHIANLRKKLEDVPSDPEYIISVRSIGYKLTE